MEDTPIQWADGTVNAVMACTGCELHPKPAEVFRDLDKGLAAIGCKIQSKTLFKKLVGYYHRKILNPGPGHLNEITSTNIWHLREIFASLIAKKHGKVAGTVALDIIRGRMKCYAAKQHFMRAANILKPERKVNKGYAPTFDQPTIFRGRVEKASRWRDLRGITEDRHPWIKGLPRLIFFSDMGDALCSKEFFPFLEGEMTHIRSDEGRRHLWLWLTKRPNNMRAFSDRIGGLPANVCAMTTVTSRRTLARVDQLRNVLASCRGLSIEPLWERIPPEELDLTGIDWVIVGGESGSGKLTRPFDITWAEELRDHCKKNGVAFFLKQLGRNPILAGQPVKLMNAHGGDWDEWSIKLRVRQFPAYFRNYRRPRAFDVG